ncbi:MAG: hypothetical protein OEY11_06355 [Gammaproteobacteria bacterium]|nr:hypothetical protein [Gammaproteobacteria bacterium]
MTLDKASAGIAMQPDLSHAYHRNTMNWVAGDHARLAAQKRPGDHKLDAKCCTKHGIKFSSAFKH